MTKTFYFLLISFLLMSCAKEKTFADDIVLTFPKEENLTYQKFNEGINEIGTGIIYIGKVKDRVRIKYYSALLPPPPPPPSLQEIKNYGEKEKIFNRYFYPQYEKINFSNKPIIFDSLKFKDIEIIIKPQDTIPKYAYNNETKSLKKYKAFPVFIKNISGKKLRLPEFKNLPFAFLNNKEKWQIIWNDNAFICGDNSWNHINWDFEPNEILIIAVNFFDGKTKGKYKVEFFNELSSDSFEMNYDPDVIKNQRRNDIVK